MNREDVHRCWAPENEPWTPWVKPVLFANLDETVEPSPLPPSPDWLRRAVIDPLVAAAPSAESSHGHPYRSSPQLRDSALVLDLPGATSALVGVGFVDFGFRPIPLYNAVPAAVAAVQLEDIMTVLVDAAARVATASPGGPPAFLLDANRMLGQGPIIPGMFDNRSVCRQSDFPSPEALWQAGIRRAVLVQSTDDRPAADLEEILFAWQRGGIALWRKSTGNATPAAPFQLARRWWPARLTHALRRSVLRRRTDGGYGMIVPRPSVG